MQPQPDARGRRPIPLLDYVATVAMQRNEMNAVSDPYSTVFGAGISLVAWLHHVAGEPVTKLLQTMSAAG